MSNEASLKIVVLLEHELRTAGKALHQLREICKDREKMNSSAFESALNTAWHACDIALWHVNAQSDEHQIVITNAPSRLPTVAQPESLGRVVLNPKKKSDKPPKGTQ